jgi:hypothetical protein
MGILFFWQGTIPKIAPYDQSPQAVSDRRLFAITLGDSKSCQIWKHRLGLTWNELVKKLSESPAGPKDGPAYTPAILKGIIRLTPVA